MSNLQLRAVPAPFPKPHPTAHKASLMAQLLSGALPASTGTIPFHFVAKKIWFCKTERTCPVRAGGEAKFLLFVPEDSLSPAENTQENSRSF